MIRNAIEQTLDSREVAEMIEKEHSKLLRDIRTYISQFREAKIGFSEFFRESEYISTQNKVLPCYKITKKGCEFIAHKLTGVKGTIFTARYINRFHEIQNELQEQQETRMPWFIRKFQGNEIMLFRDFKEITGIELSGAYTAYHRRDGLIGGRDWNGYGWKCNHKEFMERYGFEYGEEPCMCYLYLNGIPKAIRAIKNDCKDKRKLTWEAERIILEALEMEGKKKEKKTESAEVKESQKPLQITLVLNQNGIETRIC